MEIHFLHACFVLFLLNGTFMLLVSLYSEAPDPEVVAQYAWSRQMYRDETLELAKLPIWQNYRVQSMMLLALTAMIAGYFW